MGKIDPSLELAAMTNFPVNHLLEYLNGFEDIKQKSQRSFSAGTFLCNNLYFKTLTQFPMIKSLFVHVPAIPEQVDGTKTKNPVPTMELGFQIQVAAKILEFTQIYLVKND